MSEPVIGWVGYTSLRRDLLAPINGIDQYVTALPDLWKMTGNPVHWMPLKRLTWDSHEPGAMADQDEKYAHATCISYGNCFQEMMQHVNSAPVHGRYQWLEQHPYDFMRCRYEIPQLDAVIVEATGHQGSLYGVTELCKALYLANPDIGFIVVDQDLAGLSVISKLNKWHPDIDSKCIYATYHPVRKRAAQAFLAITHLDYRENPDFVLDEVKRDLCYVGNDYLRREAMLRCMRGERFHLYGRIKPDFYPMLQEAEVKLHGAFIPRFGESIEDLYRKHGLGVNVVREDYYDLNLLTPRISEVSRAGVLLFCDHRLQIARPLISDWCMVTNAEDVLTRADYVADHADYRSELIAYQRAQVNRYCNRQRYAETLYRCAKRLQSGSLGSDESWSCSLYNDLLKASHLREWENTP